MKNREQAKSKVGGHEIKPDIPNGRSWRLRIGPYQTLIIADNAPLCQMTTQNHGPGVIQVRCDREMARLEPGALWLMLGRGKISIEASEEASVDLDFAPRHKAY